MTHFNEVSEYRTNISSSGDDLTFNVCITANGDTKKAIMSAFMDNTVIDRLSSYQMFTYGEIEDAVMSVLKEWLNPTDKAVIGDRIMSRLSTEYPDRMDLPTRDVKEYPLSPEPPKTPKSV